MSEKRRKDAAVNVMIDYIHRNYITLRDEDMKLYVDHFRKVLQQLVTLMKEEDPLFNVTFREICGAGSYYDGLKVGKPEEFDMDVVISLPVNYKELNIVNEDVVPAFTKVQMKRSLELLRQHPKWTEVYRHMDSWVDEDGFLLQNKFRQWIEGVVNKGLNKLNEVERNCYELIICDPVDNSKETKYMVSLKKSGPAMTFLITMPDKVQVDVDFVPVIEFCHPQWPPEHVRKLPENSKRAKWFIVPKPKKTNNPDGTIWRLAFHEQEREMINDKGALKPVCRMLKKFRDEKNLNIASYYLKTLFLWEIDAHPDIQFWRKRHIELFLYMLDKLAEHLKNGKIPYYWDKRYNLLEGMDDVHKMNLVNRLNKIIAELKKKLPDDPLIIAKHLLPPDEYKIVQSKHVIPATALTPAKPALTPQSSRTHEETKQANSPVQTTTEVSRSPLETNLAEYSIKLDAVMNILNTLVNKVNSLERTMADIKDEIANLGDQLCLARQRN